MRTLLPGSGLVALFVAAGPVAAQDPPPADTVPAAEEPPPGRYDGEYGLWVGDRDGVLEVRWLTREEGPGFLQAIGEGGLLHEARTPPGLAHGTEFERPGRGTVLLRYGGLEDAEDRHQTEIRLDTPRRRTPSFSRVDSIFVIGDTHGELDRMRELFRNAGVVDDEDRWSAGTAHLVFVGDLMGRGPDVIPLLWYVYRLEQEAADAGGHLHVVLGNHEIMAMLDDLRYTRPRELEVARRHGSRYPDLFDVRHSLLGRWLATKPAVLRINDILFAHGGVSDDYVGWSLREFDDTLAAYMSHELFFQWADTTARVAMTEEQFHRWIDFFFDERSAFWYRGYVVSDTTGDELARVLRNFRSRVHVVAHTPTPTIHERFDGALIAAHPRRPAEEMLLLVRDRRDWRRYRIALEGPPAAF